MGMGLENMRVPKVKADVHTLTSQPASVPIASSLGLGRVSCHELLGLSSLLQPHLFWPFFSRPDPGRQGHPPSLTHPTLPSLAKQGSSREKSGTRLSTSSSVVWPSSRGQALSVALRPGHGWQGSHSPLVSLCCCVPLSCPPWLLGP